jgi:WD40 repeat protein
MLRTLANHVHTNANRFRFRLLRALWVVLVLSFLGAKAAPADDEWKEFARWKAESTSALAVTRDGRTVATGDGSNVVRLWDTSKRAVSKTLVHPGEVDTLHLSPDGKLLATTRGRRTRLTEVSAYGEVRLWNVETGVEVHTFTFFWGVNDAVFTPDGKRMIAAADAFVDAEVLELDSLSHVATLRGSGTGIVHQVHVTNSGDEVVTVDDRNGAVFWNAKTLKRERGFFYSGELAIAADEMALATCKVTDGENGRTFIETWELKTLRRKHRLEVDGSLRGIRYTPDATRICASSKRSGTLIWDSQTLQPVGEIPLAAGPIEFSAHGEFLVSPSRKNEVAIWRAPAGDRK